MTRQTTRIYLVTNGERESLVRTNSRQRAERHMARAEWTAKTATPDDVERLVSLGAVVETLPALPVRVARPRNTDLAT